MAGSSRSPRSPAAPGVARAGAEARHVAAALREARIGCATRRRPSPLMGACIRDRPNRTLQLPGAAVQGLARCPIVTFISSVRGHHAADH